MKTVALKKLLSSPKPFCLDASIPSDLGGEVSGLVRHLSISTPGSHAFSFRKVRLHSDRYPGYRPSHFVVDTWHPLFRRAMRQLVSCAITEATNYHVLQTLPNIRAQSMHAILDVDVHGFFATHLPSDEGGPLQNIFAPNMLLTLGRCDSF